MTEHHLFCRVSYWKQHTACKDADDWDTCCVTPLGMYTHGEQRLTVSANTDAERIRIRGQRNDLLAFLQKVYELGRKHAKQEIRDVLGVVNDRR